MSDIKLVIFDVDGTLVDSQADIVNAMHAAFGAVRIEPPSRDAILSIVGLSLDVAMERLAPQMSPTQLATMVSVYKDCYVSLQRSGTHAPLYPGVRKVLETLMARDELLLGIATGKSHRGLLALLAAHSLEGVFVNRQVSDHHPSKPHPAMLLAALSETGVEPASAVMIGDTSYDMDMARAAGIRGIGVSWGYHDRESLKNASQIVDNVAELPGILLKFWERAA